MQKRVIFSATTYLEGEDRAVIELHNIYEKKRHAWTISLISSSGGNLDNSFENTLMIKKLQHENQPLNSFQSNWRHSHHCQKSNLLSMREKKHCMVRSRPGCASSALKWNTVQLSSNIRVNNFKLSCSNNISQKNGTKFR